MSDGSERFADIRGVGDIAMSGEEDCSGSCGVGSVSHICLSRVRTAVGCQMVPCDVTCVDLLSLNYVVKVAIILVGLVDNLLKSLGELSVLWELLGVE